MEVWLWRYGTVVRVWVEYMNVHSKRYTNSMFEMFVRILPGSKGYIEISYIHMYTHTYMY